ncbi:MAG: FAD-dependent oxidoreductase [Dehalococcoidia bacterium]
MKRPQQFPNLFQPGYIGKVEIKNRVIMAPMAQMWAEIDGRFSQQQIDYYATRAKGGAGLIITEANFVEKKISPPSDPLAVYMDSSYHVPRASELVDAVHDFGAKIAIQLSPGPGRNMGGASPERIPISASAIPSFRDPGILCHELTIDEIKEILKACGEAAERVALAGFDIIEIHAHNGYLIDNFMTPLWNKRTDEYGGNIEGRMRFPVEIIKTMKAATGDTIPISFRYSMEHRFEGGRILAESQEIARILEAAGADVLHVDVGCHDAFQWVQPPNYISPDGFSDLSAAIKQVVNIPVITVGGITSPDIAEEILNARKADFICLGRALIADPDWPVKAEKGQLEEIRPCLRCNEGCIGRAFYLKSMSCSVNTLVGKERYYAISRAEKLKKVMVVGGGPGGMEAARIAALKGHKVTLFEREKELGGQLKAASRPPFKTALWALVKYLGFQLDKLGVKVETGKEVTPELINEFKPDVLVIATGARPERSSIPGAGNKNVMTAVDLLSGDKKIGDNVVVAGASLVGCDTALYLALEGKKVNIIKIRPGTAVAGDINQINRATLLEQLAQNNVNFVFDRVIQEFNDRGVLVIDKQGNRQTIEADTIILALGAKPENELVEHIKGEIDELYIVGDCVSPRKVGEAIHEGFVAGWRI